MSANGREPTPARHRFVKLMDPDAWGSVSSIDKSELSILLTDPASFCPTTCYGITKIRKNAGLSLMGNEFVHEVAAPVAGITSIELAH